MATPSLEYKELLLRYRDLGTESFFFFTFLGTEFGTENSYGDNEKAAEELRRRLSLDMPARRLSQDFANGNSAHSISQSVCLSVCPSVCLSICLSFCLSVLPISRYSGRKALANGKSALFFGPPVFKLNAGKTSR